MAISFPTWYAGGYEDMEHVVKVILEKHLEGTNPGVSVYAWLPDDWRDLLPIVAVARDPSGISDESQVDVGQIQLWCIANSRSDSWALAECVRQIMLAYEKGGMIDVGDHKADVRWIKRGEGPALSMDEDADLERVIPLSFNVATRVRASRPDYAQILT